MLMELSLKNILLLKKLLTKNKLKNKIKQKTNKTGKSQASNYRTESSSYRHKNLTTPLKNDLTKVGIRVPLKVMLRLCVC